MGRGISVLVILAALMAVSVSSQQAGPVQQPVESHVVPLKKISNLDMDKRFEIVSGDPTKADAPFVIRIHAEAGYIIMPHRHPVDENIVVVKGTWALGMGDRFNRDGLEPMEVGDYGFVSKKMAHFALSKTYTIIQVHGIGPFMTQWIVPVYELTDKGVLMKTGAEDPGRATPTSPDRCFDLKLGTSVREGYSEGVVVGAQCTPGELTQYRVEKPDGQRFWAQRDELNTP
jgi:quercetin dioxygenase-like cupin family protein